VLTAKLNLAAVVQRTGNVASAEELFRQTLRDMKEVLGPEHSLTLRAMKSLAELCLELRRPTMRDRCWRKGWPSRNVRSARITR